MIVSFSRKIIVTLTLKQQTLEALMVKWFLFQQGGRMGLNMKPYKSINTNM